MFDKVHLHHQTTQEGPRYPQTVHEHRAPTDDSVRLYVEFKDAAEREIVDVCLNRLGEDNSLSHVVIERQFFVEKLGTEIRIAFRLNGKTITAKVEDDEEPQMAIFRKIAEHITVALASSSDMRMRGREDACRRNRSG